MCIRKITTSLAGPLVAATALSVCAATALQAGETITYMASQSWVTEAERELGQKFEEETGIHVDYQVIPADQYYSVLKARLNSGEGPDIFGGQSSPSDLKGYNVARNAVDLSNEPWAARLDPLVADAASVDGVLYGLTYWDTIGGPWFFNFNRDVLARHDLNPPASFDELMHVCEVLKEDGVTPIYEPFADGWHQVLMFAELGPNYAAHDPGLYDRLNANTANLADDPLMKKDLEQINQLYEAECFGPYPLSDTWAGAITALATEKAAIVYGPISFRSQILQEYPDFDTSKIGVFIPPLAGNGIVGVNPAGPTKFIYTGGNVEAAKAYFNFLTRPDNMAYYMSQPTGARNLPFSDAKGTLDPDLQAFLDANSENTGVVLQTGVTYVNAQWMEIGQDISAMVTGAISPEKVLRNIDKRRATLARAMRDPAWQ